MKNNAIENKIAIQPVTNIEQDFDELFILNNLLSPEESVDDFKLYFTSFKNYFLKVTYQNRILGFVSIMYPLWNRIGIIHHLIIKPEFQRQGLATRLVKEILHFAKTVDLRFVTVQTADWNTTVIQLYLRCGFKKQYVFDSYYGDQNNMVWLDMDLTDRETNSDHSLS